MRHIIVETPPSIFHPQEPNTEDDFERQILRCAGQLFPSHVAGLWKPLIRDQWGRAARPDMVLISSEFDAWHIVEIELRRHSLATHIEQQLETLSQGIYDYTLLQSLSQAVPGIPQSTLKRVLYREPGFLCVADAYADDLQSACRDNNFELAICEPYHGQHGAWALFVSKMPVAMRPSREPGVFQLRRGKAFGDRVFMEVPQHFPFSAGVVELNREGGELSEGQVITSGPRRYLNMPLSWAPLGKSVRLSMIDQARQRLRVEVE